uniref:RAD51 paralog B n=1 Tax=Geospiza parvula TaxID=87175 RepID=A0A8C3N6A7_GEOPR
MAAKKLRRAQLSQEMCERLSRYQITTCQDFLCLSVLELMKVTGQSYYEVQKLLCKVSRACAPKMQTAYEMKLRKSVSPSSAFLSTTLHNLDRVLHGGVPCGSLTETMEYAPCMECPAPGKAILCFKFSSGKKLLSVIFVFYDILVKNERTCLVQFFTVGDLTKGGRC